MKKLTILILGILLVGGVIAIGLSNSIGTITLTKPQKTALTNAGITDVRVEEIPCEENYRCFNLIGNNLNKLNWKKVNSTLSDNEIYSYLDEQTTKELKLIADTYIKRSQSKTTTKFGNRTYTINEK